MNRAELGLTVYQTHSQARRMDRRIDQHIDRSSLPAVTHKNYRILRRMGYQAVTADVEEGVGTFQDSLRRSLHNPHILHSVDGVHIRKSHAAVQIQMGDFHIIVVVLAFHLAFVCFTP
ncbi:hypothetical protein [Gracilibacillus sp. Marseille-QA3620]